MKITVTSDDGQQVAEVDTSDIDLSGHSMNRTILMHRVESAVNAINNYDASACPPAGNRDL